MLLWCQVASELVRWRSNGEIASGLDGAEDGSLEPGEGEVERVDLGVGERVFGWVAGEGTLSNIGAAGVGEAEDFGDFVETFTDGVVTSGADNFEMVVFGHVDDLGVAAGDDEGKQREGGEMIPIGEPVGVDVGFEMVDGVERLVPKDGEHTGGKGADEERAEEAGGVGDGDVVDVVAGEVGVGEGFVDDGEDGLEVGAGGDFGDDATVGGENIDLGDDDIAEELGVVVGCIERLGAVVGCIGGLVVTVGG